MLIDHENSEHDARMNALALRVAGVLDGENLFDVACVCAIVAAYAISEGYPDLAARQAALDKVVAFMRASAAVKS